eukprot:m.176613 g.176613  ORF g.176613 m.176613 type:complete len:175 (+) comp31852_c0_seq1:627-1151(+)
MALLPSLPPLPQQPQLVIPVDQIPVGPRQRQRQRPQRQRQRPQARQVRATLTGTYHAGVARPRPTTIQVGSSTVNVADYCRMLQIVESRFYLESSESGNSELRLSAVDAVIREETGRAPKQGVTRALLEQVLGYECVQPNYCTHCDRRHSAKTCTTPHCKRNRIWMVSNMVPRH